MEDPLAHQGLSPRKFLLCCDEPVCALGLRVVVESGGGACVVSVREGEAESAHIVKIAKEYRPDVIVYDTALDSELTVLAALRRAVPLSEIVLWGRDFSAELTRQAIAMGARGFLSSGAEPDTIVECLRSAADGELWMERELSNMLLNSTPLRLSRRQGELLQLLMQGLRNREIATEMGISEGTVKAYLTTLFEKVGARDRFELALYGLRNLRNGRESADGERDQYQRSNTRHRGPRSTRAVA